MRFINYLTVTMVYLLLMLLQVVPGTETLAAVGRALGVQTGTPLVLEVRR